jgi:hypothetical protein
MKAWTLRALLAGLATLAPLTAGAQGFKYWDYSDDSKAPATLSQTGLYVNLPSDNRTLIPAAVYFDVNSPLFTDGSAKKRWVLLKPGTSIGFRESDDYWDYPDGAVFIKQFALDTVPGDSATRVLWETRLLINRKEAVDPGAPTRKIDVWYGFSYRWRPDQRDADLVPDTGTNAARRWYPQGLGKPAAWKKWRFPSRFQCMECHRNSETDSGHGRTVLGFFTAQLNMPSPRVAGKNQLADLFDRGVLSGTRPSDWNTSPRWHGLSSTHPDAGLENKARAYIAANCSGCHGTRGKALGAPRGVQFNYDFHTGKPAQSLYYEVTSWGYGLEDDAAGEPVDHPTKGVYLITPGYARKSVILHRQTLRNTSPLDSGFGFDGAMNQMPPLGTYEVNALAVQVIGAWIDSLPKTGAVSLRPPGLAARRDLGSPTLRERTVFLPPALVRTGAAVSLVDLQGRVHPLRASAPGVHPVPRHLPPGIYAVRVGAHSFLRQLL